MNEMTIEQITAELAELDREIIGLEEAVNAQHVESGSNSLDDDSKESADDSQRFASLADQIERKRHRVTELHKLLALKRAA